MQAYSKLELSVGFFMVVGLAALGYLSFTLGGVSFGEQRYAVQARFSSVGDLKVGDAVKLAGVSVGEVESIRLVDYAASVELSVSLGLELPRDTIASIQTAGLLGDAYVSLSPGAAAEVLGPGGSITRTEPAFSISELLGKYAFGSLDRGSDGASRGASPNDPASTDEL